MFRGKRQPQSQALVRHFRAFRPESRTSTRLLSSSAFIRVYLRFQRFWLFIVTYIGICQLEDIPSLGARRFKRDDGKVIAIFRNAEDKVFALQDKCPHKGGPLSQGIVFGESVACPLHNWCISLNDGYAAAPDIGVVEKFSVRVDDGKVELDPWSGVMAAMDLAAE